MNSFHGKQLGHVLLQPWLFPRRCRPATCSGGPTATSLRSAGNPVTRRLPLRRLLAGLASGAKSRRGGLSLTRRLVPVTTVRRRSGTVGVVQVNRCPVIAVEARRHSRPRARKSVV